MAKRSCILAWVFLLTLMLTAAGSAADPFSPILEAQGWSLGSTGALPPLMTNVDGVACLRFPCVFATNTTRAAWDRTLIADLSGVSQIVFRYKVSDHRKIAQFSIYLKSGKGYYHNLAALPVINDGWNTVSVPRAWFYSIEGPCDGWTNIDGIRISPWQSEPGDFSFYLADVKLVAAGPGENLLANSGFEFSTTESFPDFWGPGHWSLSANTWIADTPAWRTRWGVVTDAVHSGSRAMRIIGDTNTGNLKLSSTWVLMDADREHTFSAWMKSDRDGLPVSLSIEGVGGKQLTVGRSWGRYSFTGVDKKPRARICTITPLTNGTLWIDDVKLEQGATPADWKPAAVDASITVERPQTRMTDPGPYETKPLTGTATVSVDEHRRVLVNGKPFIPFATGWERAVTPEIIRDTALSGFNTICWGVPAGLTPDAHQKLLDTAKENGLMVIVWFLRNITADAMREHISQFKDHPSVLAWYVYDEPAVITPAIQERYDVCRTLDPMRPAYLNYILYPENKLGDIASMDLYPIPQNTPAIQAGLARTLEYSASRAGKPSWVWLQNSGYAYFKSREPTGPEAECMTYVSLINGVRGIKWFTQKPLTVELNSAMRQLAREARTLTPVLYSLDEAPNVSVTTKDIDFVVKKLAGEIYIIAVNTQPYDVAGVFTLQKGTGKTAAVMFEGRIVSMNGAMLKDSFLGFQRHVYRLSTEIK